MKEKFKVGVLGATGMVGQRFISILENHPWFDVTLVAASPQSSGKSYIEAIKNRWVMKSAIPKKIENLTVQNASDVEKITSQIDFVFCAVDMSKEEIFIMEEQYAKAETPVISNNSAHRFTPDVPMILPEINPEHTGVIDAQRKRLGVKRGFITVKPNCSLQSYVPALHPLIKFGIKNAAVTTYQAISGAGKTFENWPEMIDNVIPFIKGEEEKSEKEPLKIWGHIENGIIIPSTGPVISSQCIRVPVTDGHLAAVFISFEKKPSAEEIINLWKNYEGKPQKLNLPNAPKPFLTYFTDENRPQTKPDRNLGNGMGIGIGRLRADNIFDYKFVCLSHNTIRGAAGGAVLTAELLAEEGYIQKK